MESHGISEVSHQPVSILSSQQQHTQRVLEHPLPHGLQYQNISAMQNQMQDFVQENSKHLQSTLHPQFTPTAIAPSECSIIQTAFPCSDPNNLVVPPPSTSNVGFHHSHVNPGDDDLKSDSHTRGSRSRGTSGSSFSSRSLSSSRSRRSSSQSGSSSSSISRKGDRKSRRRARRQAISHQQLAGPINFPQMLGTVPDPRMLLPPGMPGGAPLSVPFGPRGAYPSGPPALFSYPSPILGHQQPPMATLGHPQFGNMLSSIPGLGDPSGFGGPPGLYAGPRGSIRPGFHAGAGPRFMVEGSAPHLADESLPTFPNAAAAPNRLPAHKPVRLTQPKHPLAPPGTPVYFKYGEEHYPEETVPPEYTFTETDGTVCRYITNFLVYNKRGERLLPIEVLDQPRHAALVLYGSLLPATAMSQNASRSGRRDSEGDADGLRSKKRAAAPQPGGVGCSKRHMAGNREGSNRRKDGERWVSERGMVSGGITQTYPVRVELAEWCIDYGQEPTNVPFIWLISRWDVYYRLEKPAGRYIPTFATAKMKFEVSTRVIKTLQHRPETSYKTLVDLLTAATRLEKTIRKAERRALIKKERRAQRRSVKVRGIKNDSDGETVNDVKKLRVDEMRSQTEHGLKNEDFYDHKPSTAGSDVGVTGPTKKKNRNWRIQSLSTPQGTGVVITDAAGRPHALTPWGAPYAVDGFKESMLLGLAEFLESQLRNFMEGVGGSVDSAGGCPNLLGTPFMRMLRERTALRMETIQLMEAKRRALEVAKSLAEAASSHVMTPISIDPSALVTSDIQSGAAEHQQHFMQYQGGAGRQNGYPTRPPQFFSGEGNTNQSQYFNPNNSMNIMSNQSVVHGSAGDGISALESEIQHLQQLLKDSDDEEGESESDDDVEDAVSEADLNSLGHSNGSYSDNEDSAGGNHLGPGGVASGPGRPCQQKSQRRGSTGGMSKGGVYQQERNNNMQQQDFRLIPSSTFDYTNDANEDEGGDEAGGSELSLPFSNGSPVRWRRRDRTHASQAVLDFSADSISAEEAPGEEGASGTGALVNWGEFKYEPSNLRNTETSYQPGKSNFHKDNFDTSVTNNEFISSKFATQEAQQPSSQLNSQHQSQIPPISQDQAIASTNSQKNSLSLRPSVPNQQPSPIISQPTPTQKSLVSSATMDQRQQPNISGVPIFHSNPYVLGQQPRFLVDPHQPLQRRPEVMTSSYVPYPGISPWDLNFFMLPPHLGGPGSLPLSHQSVGQSAGMGAGPSVVRRSRSTSADVGMQVPIAAKAFLESHLQHGESLSKRRKLSLGESQAHDEKAPKVKRQAIAARSPKVAARELKVNIAAPPFPRDVADDLDLPVSDLKYYRSPLSLDRFEVIKHPQVLTVSDFLETTSDWIFQAASKHMGLRRPWSSIMKLQSLLGFGPKRSLYEAEFLMTVILRLFSRRYEKLRATESSTATYLVQKFAENLMRVSRSSKPESPTPQPTENEGDPSQPDKEFAGDPHRNDDPEVDLNNAKSLQWQLPYHSWLPASVTSKQPPQVLTATGWANANTSYAPIEVILSQNALRALTSVAKEMNPATARKHLAAATSSSDEPASTSARELLESVLSLHMSRGVASSISKIQINAGTLSETEEAGGHSASQGEVKQNGVYRGRLPRAADLGLGLLAGIHWWKDEGSIDLVTWEFYLRLTLWESLCAVRPEELKRRRVAAESGHSKKKKKKLNIKQSIATASDQPDSVRAEENLEDESVHESRDQENESTALGFAAIAPSTPSATIGDDEEADTAMLKGASEEEEDEDVPVRELGWSWDVDTVKAFSCGLMSQMDIRRMKKLLELSLGVSTDDSNKTSMSGWASGFSASDRLFILNWIVSVLTRSPLGRDMVDRRLDLFGLARSTLFQREKERVANTELLSKVIKSEETSSKEQLMDDDPMGPTDNLLGLTDNLLVVTDNETLAASCEETTPAVEENLKTSIPVKVPKLVTAAEAKEALFTALETLGRRFYVRKECLGEDRFLNRYFVFENGGVSDIQLMVEFHLLIPLNSSKDSSFKQVIVESRRLPKGVATNNDINYAIPETHGSTCLLGSPMKRSGARGRPRKSTAEMAARKRTLLLKAEDNSVTSNVQSDNPTQDRGENELIDTNPMQLELQPDHALIPPSDRSELPEQPILVDSSNVLGSSVPQGDGGGTNSPEIRRSERSTKGKRSTKSFLEAGDENSGRADGVEDEKQHTGESTNVPNPIKRVPYMHATFLETSKRQSDGAISVRRPLDGCSYFSTSPVEMADEPSLQGCLGFTNAEEELKEQSTPNETEVIEYSVGPFRPLPFQLPKRKKRNQPSTALPVVSDEEKVDEENIVDDEASRNNYIPVIQWGVIKGVDSINALVDSLSSFTTRERQLKSQLTKLIESEMVQDRHTSSSISFGRFDEMPKLEMPIISNATEQLLFNSVEDSYVRLTSLFNRLKSFNDTALAFSVSPIRCPDFQKFCELCETAVALLPKLPLNSSESCFDFMFVLLRTALILCLVMVRISRSVPYISKLVTSVPACGWNTRSSPAQWDTEMKAIEWALIQLSCDKQGNQQSICQTVFARVNPEMLETEIGCKELKIVSQVLSDFISLVGLYYTLYCRFGFNRIPLEHLISTVVPSSAAVEDVLQLPASDRLKPGTSFLLKRKEYLAQLQTLKASGVPAVDDWLPHKDDFMIEVLQVFYHFCPISQTNVIREGASSTGGVTGEKPVKSSSKKKAASTTAINNINVTSVTSTGHVGGPVEAFDPYARLLVKLIDEDDEPRSFHVYVGTRNISACMVAS